MMKRTNETGRSMVEMLGVLAIIGVLSVGGIAGYTMAMNRYRANEVIDMANKYAVVAFAARETNRTMNNGTVTAAFKTPTFCNTGLVGTTDSNCKVNGTTIGTPKFYTTIDCSGDEAGTSATARSAGMVLTFEDEAVCKAAASTLGTTCGATSGGGATPTPSAANSKTVTFCSRNS